MADQKIAPISVVPIGFVKSSRKKMHDDQWDREKSYIELDANQFSVDALAGLELFSHIEVIFFMDRVEQKKIETGSRHPRNDNQLPRVGIFAQRGKNRPNRIGATVCAINKIDGHKIYIQGLDAIDQTPVLDVKPWVTEFGPRGMTRQPQWASQLMKNYWNSNPE